VLVDFGRGVYLGLPGTQAIDSLLPLSKDLYLREQLMVDLHHCLTFAFGSIVMDGDEFSLAIGLRLLFIQSSSQVDHRLDKLSAREGRWIEFVISVYVMLGGVLVRYVVMRGFFL